MSLDEALHPSRKNVDPQLSRVLFELCCNRVDQGTLQPTEIAAEMARLIGVSNIAPIDPADLLKPEVPHYNAPLEALTPTTIIGLLEK